MGHPLRVAVIDDNAELRRAYGQLLVERGDYSLAGVAGDGQAGVDLFLRQRPDVTIMDLMMPIMSGTEATQKIHLLSPTACVLILTSHVTYDRLFAALQVGAAGYIHKSSTPAEICQAISDAHANQMPLSPAVRHLLTGIAQRFPTPAKVSSRDWLTARESGVLQLLAEGLTNQQIAQILFISHATVKKHISNIGDKLGVTSRTHILVTAARMGIISLIDSVEDPTEKELSLSRCRTKATLCPEGSII